MHPILADFDRRDWLDDEPERTVRIAMLGLGWWTREQAIPAVEQSSFCETTVLVSSSTEKATRYADLAESIERGISYEEFHDGVAAEAYDAVYICTPNALHLPYVETAVGLGKDVLCEKPLEATVERAERIRDLDRSSDATVMVAYRMQTEPTVRRARELIREGIVGDVVQLHGAMSQRLLEVIPDENQWRLDPDLSGGATVMDIGLYPINTMRFLLDADPVAVQSMVTHEHDAFADVGDEHAAFTLAFPDGVYAACTASQAAYRSSHLRITGTEGEIVLDPVFFPQQDRGFRLSVDDTDYRVDFEQVDQMTEEFDHFAYCVTRASPVTADAAHGLVDMRVMAGIYEAATTGAVVDLSSGDR